MSAPPGPHFPAEASLAQVNAVKALYAGQASEQQQKLALAWIIHGAAAIDDLSYRPGDGMATAFAEGKRRVGLNIKRLIEMTEDKLKTLAAKEQRGPAQETSRG